MLTLFFANGSKKVTNLHPSFFSYDKATKSTAMSKAKDIMADAGAIKFVLERIVK